MARTGLSRGDVLLLAIVLGVAGMVDAAYLTWQWYAGANASWCDINAYLSCSRVRSSIFASIGGVPTAVVGLVGFGILAGLAILALRGRTRMFGRSIDTLLFGFAILGALIGIALSAIEVFVIQAVCILCVIGFVLDLGVVAIGASLVRGGTRAPAGATYEN